MALVHVFWIIRIAVKHSLDTFHGVLYISGQQESYQVTYVVLCIE